MDLFRSHNGELKLYALEKVDEGGTFSVRAEFGRAGSAVPRTEKVFREGLDEKAADALFSQKLLERLESGYLPDAPIEKLEFFHPGSGKPKLYTLETKAAGGKFDVTARFGYEGAGSNELERARGLNAGAAAALAGQTIAEKLKAGFSMKVESKVAGFSLPAGGAGISPVRGTPVL